jgi:hypothetical protein
MALKRAFRLHIFALIFVGLFSINISFAQTLGVTTDITKIGIGAKSLGMGGSGVALSESNSFINPATLAGASTYRVSSMYTSLMNDVGYAQGSIVYPSEYGVFGIGYLGASTGDSYVTKRGTGNRIELSDAGAMSYNNSLILLSYAKELNDQLSVGTNLKVYKQELKGGTLSNASGTGYNADLGIIYNVNPWLSLGLNQQGLLSTSKITWGSGSQDTIPSVTKLGSVANLLDDRFRVEADLDILGQNKPSLLHTGIEWTPFDFISIRGGLDQRVAAGASASSVGSDITAGVGLKYGDVQFDYAYHQYDNSADLSTHYFSISFTGSQPTFLGEKEKAEYLAKRAAEQKAALTAKSNTASSRIVMSVPQDSSLTLTTTTPGTTATKSAILLRKSSILGRIIMDVPQYLASVK